jgi:hypothetical protein
MDLKELRYRCTSDPDARLATRPEMVIIVPTAQLRGVFVLWSP